MIIQRLKNLWKLSEYSPDHQRDSKTQLTYPVLKRTIPYQPKPATIVDMREAPDEFNETN